MTLTTSLLVAIAGLLVSLCSLCLALSLNLVKFASLITSLQRDLLSLKRECHGLRFAFRKEMEETKQWQQKVEGLIYKPSWKTTDPRQSK